MSQNSDFPEQSPEPETEAAAQPQESFADFPLAAPILRAVADAGYQSPSPIQAASLTPLLEGRDLVGQAQTGTGKTAAFSLPLLSRLYESGAISANESDKGAGKAKGKSKDKTPRRGPGMLVLAPTRELAMQVAEAVESYARHLKHLRVQTVYGGQGMDTQLRALKRGVDVVVGTPGRLIDHLKRGTLQLDSLQALVLDEADEMLKMGFIDDVEWILEQAPEERQVALFSATMPPRIRKIAGNHLRNPVEIKIASKTSTVDTITQRYWFVGGISKVEAVGRLLEVEDVDGMIIFVRTKNATVELAEKLEERGFNASPLNGDMNQALREKTIERLKKHSLDVLIATDVAARGLDVERISHVINYDIPFDTEAYVHRIGRTGRAGRRGQAILFVTPREKRMLRTIERATRQPIAEMKLPGPREIGAMRVQRFKERLGELMDGAESRAKTADPARDLDAYGEIIAELVRERAARAAAETQTATAEQEVDAAAVNQAAQDSKDAPLDTAMVLRAAGALTYLLQRERPFHPPANRKQERQAAQKATAAERKGGKAPGSGKTIAFEDLQGDLSRPAKASRRSEREDETIAPELSAKRAKRKQQIAREVDLVRYRIAVGKLHGVEPTHIVGAIANESGLESAYIGEIKLYDDYSTVDLPDGMPKAMLQILKKTRVMGQKLKLTPENNASAAPLRAAGAEESSSRRSSSKPASKKITLKTKRGAVGVRASTTRVKSGATRKKPAGKKKSSGKSFAASKRPGRKTASKKRSARSAAPRKR